jgi:hypothetical protein
LERREELAAFAESIAREAGAIKACESHDDISIDQWDDDAKQRAYAIGTNRWKSGDIDASREDLMNAIKSAIDHSAESCPHCEKNMAD